MGQSIFLIAETMQNIVEKEYKYFTGEFLKDFRSLLENELKYVMEPAGFEIFVKYPLKTHRELQGDALDIAVLVGCVLRANNIRFCYDFITQDRNNFIPNHLHITAIPSMEVFCVEPRCRNEDVIGQDKGILIYRILHNIYDPMLQK